MPPRSIDWAAFWALKHASISLPAVLLDQPRTSLRKQTSLWRMVKMSIILVHKTVVTLRAEASVFVPNKHPQPSLGAGHDDGDDDGDPGKRITTATGGTFSLNRG